MVEAQKSLWRAVILVAVAAAACLAAAPAGAAPLGLTGNATGKSVSVFNTRTNKTVGEPIELGSEAGGIAIVPGGAAYVAETEKEAVAVIDPTTRKVLTTVPVGQRPEFVAVSPDGKTVWVTDHDDEDVALIDTTSNVSPGSLPVGDEPRGLAIAPNGKFLYVSVAAGLVTIDTATEEVGKPVATREGPRLVAFSPDGSTAYVSEENVKAVGIVNTALRQEVGSIPMPGTNPFGLAVSPDGKTLYVGNDVKAGTVTAFSTASGEQLGQPIKVGEGPTELAVTPDGSTLYVIDFGSNQVTPIETASRKSLTPIELPGLGPSGLAITPDQSPTAAFAPPAAVATQPTAFSGAGSTDPDGSIAAWSWIFGDGGAATGVAPVHTYAAPGIYSAQLSVVDNEGCGTARVFTGRTAYCSGNATATVSHPVAASAMPPAPPLCSRNFAIVGMSHNRKNGTVRLRVKFPGTGSFLLFGKKVHAITRKVRTPGTAVLILHPRVELAKRLKKTLRAPVRYRLTFTPSGSCGTKTVHRSVALLRAPRHRRHR